LYHSSAGLQVNQYRMDVLANNLANAHTTGFKQDLAVVTEREVESLVSGDFSARHNVLDEMTGGSFVRPTFTDYTAGALTPSNNPLDVALPENGFLSVRDGDATRYTQDGRITLNRFGDLVMSAGGREVLDESGRPMRARLDDPARVMIGPDGFVRQGESVLGRLGLVEFDSTQALVKRGGGLYEAVGQAARPSHQELTVGMTEGSNVSPVGGLASMIEVGRAYEMNARMMTLQDQSLGRAVNDIARLA
jgi:flagellar basal-body rod protein FlgG